MSSDLVVIAYDDEATAKNALGTLKRLQHEQLIELDDAAIAARDGAGKISIHQEHSAGSAFGTASGAFWGGLLGIVFFVPLLGIALGGVAGALSARASDYGIDEKLLQTVSQRLDAGHALLFLLIHKSTPEKVLPEIAHFGGHVVQTSLTPEAQAALETALETQVTR